MSDDADPPADTIEWGDAPAERRPWLNPGAPATAEQPARERLNPVAIGLAVAGFALVLGAQYLPWLHVRRPRSSGPSDDDVAEELANGLDFELAAIPTVQPLSYNLSLVLVLVLVAVILVMGPRLRRIATAGALGALAANVALLVGMGRALSRGGLNQFGLRPGDVDISLGSGYTLALLAVGLLAGAVLVAARGPFARRAERSSEAAEESSEPIDLTVTALPQERQR